jgi:hypothetical protein
MTAAEKYVAGAYLVVFLTVLAYVLIIALKIARLEQSLGEVEATVSAMLSPPETAKATRAEVPETTASGNDMLSQLSE